MSEVRTATRIVVVTRNHWVEGTWFLKDIRVSDTLNSPPEKTIQMVDTKIARLNEPEKVLGQHPTGILAKSGILLAFEVQTADKSLNQLYHRVGKDKHALFLGFEGVELVGNYHSKDKADLQRLLANPEHTFIPITEATVTLPDNPLFVIKQSAVVINAQRLFYVAEVE